MDFEGLFFYWFICELVISVPQTVHVIFVYVYKLKVGVYL